MFIHYREFAIKLTIPDSFGYLKDFLKQYFAPYFTFESVLHTNCEQIAELSFNTAMNISETDFEMGKEQLVDGSKGFLNLRAYARKNTAASSESCILLKPYDCLVTFYAARGMITVQGKSILQLRIPALRLIEDLFSNTLQNHHYFLVHASAVSIKNKAVLFIGNKGAGKTTLLSRCLGHFHCEKIANDNVVMWIENGELKIRGWPAFFKVQAGTLATTTELTRDFPAHALSTLADDEALWRHYEKVPLYPLQAAERFGTQIHPEANVATLIFPQFSMDTAPSLTPVVFETVAPDFKQFLQGINNPNHPEWMSFNPVDLKNFETAYRHFMEQMNALNNTDIYRLNWAPSIEDMLSRVPSLRASNKNRMKAASAAKIHDDWQKL